MRSALLHALLLACLGSCGGTTDPYRAVFGIVYSPGSSESWTAGAAFMRDSGPPNVLATGYTIGPCWFIGHPPYDDQGPRPEFIDAGPIVLAAGGRDYPLGSDRPILGPLPFRLGEPVTFRGSGSADVPAFSITAPTADGTTLEPPAPVQPRGSDLVLRWKVGGLTDLIVGLSGDDARGPERPGVARGLHAYCRFPAGPGTGTIPSAVLERFAPGRAVLGADALTESQHTIGRFAATAQVFAPMKSPDAVLELR